jgi:hypothetical protein
VSIVLDLPPELETELAAEAAKLGLPLRDYALRLLAGAGAVRPTPNNGSELLSYWQDEGLVGTRPDILDAPAHARSLRERAQTRGRP